MEDQFNVLKVNIYGNDYPIKGNTDVEYIRRVAKYVDSKMREVNKNVSSDSSLKVAILAALNITDELFRERSLKKESNSKDFSDRINKMTELLDEKLKSSYQNNIFYIFYLQLCLFSYAKTKVQFRVDTIHVLLNLFYF